MTNALNDAANASTMDDVTDDIIYTSFNSYTASNVFIHNIPLDLVKYIENYFKASEDKFNFVCFLILNALET